MSAPPMPHYGIVKGPNGLRAGWRLLIFIAILVSLGYAMSRGLDAADSTARMWRTSRRSVASIRWIVSPSPADRNLDYEQDRKRRTFADYGLAMATSVGRRFWQGAGIGFASLTVLLLAMRLAGVLSFGPISLHGLTRGSTLPLGCTNIPRCVT